MSQKSETTNDEVRHVWMPSRLSLCGLASVMRVDSQAEVDAARLALADAPACRACNMIASALMRSAEELAATGQFDRSEQDARQALGGTTWPWVISSLKGA